MTIDILRNASSVAFSFFLKDDSFSFISQHREEIKTQKSDEIEGVEKLAQESPVIIPICLNASRRKGEAAAEAAR